MFKCAFLGCGGRARGHARAYQHVRRGKLEAICDMNTERLQKFGDEFGIAKRYTNLDQMLDTEEPDLLHIVTPPSIRHSLMKVASDHRVPGVIVEKPIAIQGEDWRDLKGLCETSKTKFAVNTQLHFHPRNLDLKRTVAEGKIGQIKFIDASARSTPINQGPHVLQLISSYLDNSRPVKVFGQISGSAHFESSEPSPGHAVACITYANGIRAMATFGTEGAPKSNENDSVYMHKRIAVFGTKGFIHWHMAGWERFTPEGGYESGQHGYGEQDVLGQAGLTEAMFDWIADDGKVHPTHLAQSLAEFNLIMAIYVSGMEHRPIPLPFDPPDRLIPAIKSLLAGR